MLNVLFAVAMLAIVLGILVLVHELGHYMACKLFGVWVYRFSIGYGSPVPGLRFQRGETEWAISWLPLGGYVKMASREEATSAALEGRAATVQVPPDRMFEAKPVWQRMVIILAGVTLNTLFAWLVFSGLAWKNGEHTDPTTTIGAVRADLLPSQAAGLASLAPGTRVTAINGEPMTSWDDIVDRITNGGRDSIAFTFANARSQVVYIGRDALVKRAQLAGALVPEYPAVVGSIEAGYPAAAAGFQPGDSITAIDGHAVTQWADAVRLIQAAPGREVAVQVERQGTPETLPVTPKAEPNDSGTGTVGKLGVYVRTPVRVEPLGPIGALAAGGDATLSSAGLIVRMIRGILNRQVASNQLGGPILIGQMAAQQARAGLDSFVWFLGLISINLAVVNLLPIPVLDGGAFLLLVVEGLRGKPLPARVREAVTAVGLVLVVLLMVLVFKNDIARLIAK
jgi:regulator of sigma E protease